MRSKVIIRRKERRSEISQAFGRRITRHQQKECRAAANEGQKWKSESESLSVVVVMIFGVGGWRS